MPDQSERDILVALAKVGGKPAARPLPKLNICRDVGLKIGRDGTWFYQGSPIGRKPLVKLFSSVLREEEDGYFLVTPVEKVPIEVEGMPFVAVEMQREGSGKTQRLTFRTNVDDVVLAGGDHRLGFARTDKTGFIPFIVVRDGLTARLARPVYYELAALAVSTSGEGRPGVWSGGTFFPFPAEVEA
jgi:uncharacterized protein